MRLCVHVCAVGGIAFPKSQTRLRFRFTGADAKEGRPALEREKTSGEGKGVREVGSSQLGIRKRMASGREEMVCNGNKQ